jgi:hypothetical protein
MGKLGAGLILVGMFLGGCQTARPLYYWGHYEPEAYLDYAKPGKLPVEQEILDLQQDVQKAAALNLPVHPGLHAQLGYLYSRQGKEDLARKEFETEKALFPESATFMDRLVNQSKPK